MVNCPFCSADVQNLKKHIEENHPGEIRTNLKPAINPALVMPQLKDVTEDIWTKQRRQLERMNEVLLLQIQQQQLVKALQTGNLSPFTPAPNNENTTLREAIKIIKDIQGLDFRGEAAPEEENDPLMAGAIEIIKAAAVAKMGQSVPPPPVEVKKPWEDLDLPPAPKEIKENKKGDDEK